MANPISLKAQTVPLRGQYTLWSPRGGHSHMSVDIKCLSIDPLFYADPTPNDPLFLFSPHLMTPFFPLLYQILHNNWNFCALRAHFEKFNNFCGNFKRKFANFALKLHFCTLNEPHFWESTSEKPPFFWCPHRMTPFFLRNPTPNAPIFVLR